MGMIEDLVNVNFSPKNSFLKKRDTKTENRQKLHV